MSLIPDLTTTELSQIFPFWDEFPILTCFFQMLNTFRYCGTALIPTGSSQVTQSSTPIITCDRPFRMFTQTGVLTPGNADPANAPFSSGTANPAGAPAAQTGFQFTYRQLPGNC